MYVWMNCFMCVISWHPLHTKFLAKTIQFFFFNSLFGWTQIAALSLVVHCDAVEEPLSSSPPPRSSLSGGIMGLAVANWSCPTWPQLQSGCRDRKTEKVLTSQLASFCMKTWKVKWSFTVEVHSRLQFQCSEVPVQGKHDASALLVQCQCSVHAMPVQCQCW